MKRIIGFVIILLFIPGLYAKTERDVADKDRKRQEEIIRKNLEKMNQILKMDYNKREIIVMRNYISKRLGLLAKGGHVLEIIKKVVPWAVMEGLKAEEAARVIVYLDQAVRAGVSFEDAEDLIRPVAKYEMAISKFLLLARYNQETKGADIPEVIRRAFLSSALQRGWDGISVLGGGRGLIMAKGIGMNLDKASKRLLNILPKNGRDVSPKRMISLINRAIAFKKKKEKFKGLNKKFAANFSDIHRLDKKKKKKSQQDLKNLFKELNKLNYHMKKFSKLRNKTDEDTIPPEKELPNWKIIKTNVLISVIRPWIGTRYRWGGTTKRGVDCSGFTLNVLTNRKIGVPRKLVPRSSRHQYSIRKGKKLSARGRFQTGDLIFFSASPGRRKITHVALAVSSTEFYHASSSRGVIKAKMGARYWRSRIVAGKRHFSRVAQ